MVVRRGPFSKMDKVVAWCLSGVCLIAGSVGIAFATANMHWILGLVSVGARALGIFYAVAAERGRPI
jgi:hypothetical protein